VVRLLRSGAVVEETCIELIALSTVPPDAILAADEVGAGTPSKELRGVPK